MLNLSPLVHSVCPRYPILRQIASAELESKPSSQTVPPLFINKPRILAVAPTALLLESIRLNSEKLNYVRPKFSKISAELNPICLEN